MKHMALLCLLLFWAVPAWSQTINVSRPRLFIGGGESTRIGYLNDKITAAPREWTSFQTYISTYCPGPVDNQPTLARDCALYYRLNEGANATYGTNGVTELVAYMKYAYHYAAVSSVTQSTIPVVRTTTSHDLSNGGYVAIGGTGAVASNWDNLNYTYYAEVQNTTLSVAIISGDTNLTVADASTIAIGDRIRLASPTNPYLATEAASVTGKTGNVLTVTRASDSTTAVSWGIGTLVRQASTFTPRCQQYITFNYTACVAQGANRYLNTTSYASWASEGMSGSIFKNGNGMDVLNQMRWHTPWIAAAYDWLHNVGSWAASDKQAIRDYLIHTATRNPADWNGSGDCDSTIAIGNLCLGQFLASSMAAIATSGEWSGAQAMVNTVKAKLDSVLIPAIGSGGRGQNGFGLEGQQYDPESHQIVMDLMEALRTGTNYNPFASDYATIHSDHFGLITSYTSPQQSGLGTNYETLPYSDLDSSNISKVSYYDRFAMLAVAERYRLAGNSTYSGYTKWWVDNIKPYSSFTGAGDVSGTQFWGFLYYPNTMSATDYRPSALPLQYRLPGIRFVAFRSDLTTSANFGSFHGGPVQESHTHGETGMFNLYRNGKPLLWDSGGYSGAIPYWFQKNGVGLPGFRGSLTTGEANAKSGEPSALAYNATSTYVYQYLNLAPAYNNAALYPTGGVQTNHLTTYRRHQFYLRPNVVVIADYVAYNGSIYPSGAITGITFRTPANAWSVVSGRFTADNGTERATVDRIYPTSGTAVARNGKRYNIIHAQPAASPNGTLTEIIPDHYTSFANGDRVSISGATGDWAALNGTRTVTVTPIVNNQPLRYLVDVNSSGFTNPYTSYWGQNAEVARDIGVDPAYVTADFCCPNVSSAYRNSVSAVSTVVFGFRVEDADPTRKATENTLYVIRTGSASATQGSATRLTSGNLNAVQFDSFVVGISPGTSPTFPLTYTYTQNAASSTHYIAGLTASTSYRVDKASVNVSITTAGAGDLVTTDAAGILVYVTAGTGGDSIQINLGGALTFSCVEAGANPANQTLSFSSSGTGPLDQFTASEASSWLSVSPGSGTVAQNLTVSVDCTSLTPATYNGTITVTSSTSGVTNSPQTAAVTLTVTAASSLALTPELPFSEFGLLGVVYTQTFVSSGGTGMKTFTCHVCPAELSIGSSTGILTGTPVSVGDIPVTIRVTDGAASTADYIFTWKIQTEATDVTLPDGFIVNDYAYVKVRKSGLDAAQNCQVSIRDADSSLLGSTTLPKGSAVRDAVVFLGGTGQVPYRLNVSCAGNLGGSVNLTPVAEDAGARTVYLSIGPPAILAAVNNVLVEYGSTSSLGSSATTACTTSCLVSLSTTTGPLYRRVKWRDVSNNVLATGAIEVALVR